jgi:hypothetical protein
MDSDPQVDALVLLDFPSVLFRSGDDTVRIIVGPALDAPDRAVRIQDGAAALALGDDVSRNLISYLPSPDFPADNVLV